MTTERSASRSRPRSWLLIALGVVLVALLFTRMWSNGAPVRSGQPAPPRDGKPGQVVVIDPNELNVRLDELEAEKPGQGEMERNPFRFQPKAPPRPVNTDPEPLVTGPPPVPPPPRDPGPPPIPLKLTGFVELPGGGKLAALSDCSTRATFNVAEGKTVDGQYRVVKIGIESVTIERINGKGRETLLVQGCPPRDR